MGGGGELSRQERSHLLKEALREELDHPEHHAMLKQIFKESLTEWLDAKWAEVGKWSFRGLVAALVSGIVWLWAKSKGLI